MGQRQSSSANNMLDNPLNPGLDSQPNPIFFSEVKRLNGENHRFVDQSKPTVYSTLLNQIYNESILLPKIMNAIREGHLFDVKNGLRVEASAATAENPAILGLIISKEEHSLLEKALEPLVIYLNKVKRGISAESDKRTYSLDSLRYVNKVNFTRESAEQKISSSFLGDALFNVILTYLKYSDESSGVRVAATKNLKIALWDKSNKHCYACDIKLKADNWEAGHIRSVKHGGQTCLDNMRPVCRDCNAEMSSMNMLEYILRKDLDGKINLTAKQIEIWQAIITLTDAISGDEKLADLAYQDRLKVIAEKLTIPSPAWNSNP